MRFLLDQDVYAVTVRLLRDAGHDVLTAAGFAVYGNDHRGHGRTAPFPPKPSALSATASIGFVAQFTLDQFQV